MISFIKVFTNSITCQVTYMTLRVCSDMVLGVLLTRVLAMNLDVASD